MPRRILVRRGGAYNRLVEPGWRDPLDTSYSKAAGGRWNSPGEHGALYLNDNVATARLQVHHKLAGLPYAPEDLNPDSQHDLVGVEVAPADYLDCASADGLAAVGLPSTYPRHRNGRPVTHATCRPVGRQDFDHRLPGIACRSAAAGAGPDNQELAVYEHASPAPSETVRLPFADWWWLDRPLGA